jgi:hypothetical protein
MSDCQSCGKEKCYYCDGCGCQACNCLGGPYR